MRQLLLVLLVVGLAAAEPIVHLTPAQRTRLQALRAQYAGSWNGYALLEPDPENAKALLAICEEAREVPEITSAISEANSLYSANPSAGASRNGKPYQRLPVDADYRNVCRHLLQHPSAKVREFAAGMAENCIWGQHPDESFFPLLVSAYDREPDANSRRNILAAFASCHAASKPVADMLLRGLRDVNSRIINMALADVALRYRKGTDYGPAFKAQAIPLIRRHLSAPEQDTRYEAYSCLVHMTPRDERRSALAPLLRQGLRDQAGGVVAQVMLMVEEDKVTALLPDVVEHLDDRRPGRLYSESMAEPGTQPGWGGDLTPVQHFALRCLARLTADLLGSRGFNYQFADKTDGQPIPNLQGEVIRAKAWLKANQAVLRASR